MTLIASGATHYVRHATNDYLYGALMGLSIVVMLLIPVFKQRLLNRIFRLTAFSFATRDQSRLVPGLL